jgi:two-component system NtrC family sensor kinase
LRHRFKDRVNVVTEFEAPDIVECYPGLLNQAIMNLLANSLDAIEGTGAVTISTGADADAFTISVTDTGTGIPEAIRERVFEPFFTTKAPGTGTGLGLAITYAIVQKHRGSLEVHPALPSGTRAVIRFPLSLPRD